MKEQIYTVKVSERGRSWYKDSECTVLHRLDGPAAEWTDGTKKYFQDGELHRIDGPASEFSDGTKQYWKDGKLHREDGPAIEWSDGTKEHWLNGIKYSEKEYWKEVNKNSCSDKVVEIDGKRYKLVEL